MCVSVFVRKCVRVCVCTYIIRVAFEFFGRTQHWKYSKSYTIINFILTSVSGFPRVNNLFSQTMKGLRLPRKLRAQGFKNLILFMFRLYCIVRDESCNFKGYVEVVGM